MTRIVITHHGRVTRWNILREYATYADTGCSLHPACLSCPRPRCRYDRRSTHQHDSRKESPR